MAHGAYIEMIGCSQAFKKDWKVVVSKKDYTGSVIYRNVPAQSPFVLRKDAASAIRGTSFEFTIKSIADFEFIDMFTNDTKEYLVEAYDDLENLVWSGYLLPEQYQETYKPAPNYVSFAASDQLGLLKDAVYTSLTLRKSLLTILGECLANTGLLLGYSIVLGIKEVRQTANRTALSEVYVNAGIYNNMKCYDVIESILNTFDATITQDSGRWFISDSYKTAVQINYNYLGLFASVGTALDSVVLGQYGNAGTDLWPTGSPLDMTLQTSFKTLKIIDEYGTGCEMLPPSDREAWGLTTPPSDRVEGYPLSPLYWADSTPPPGWTVFTDNPGIIFSLTAAMVGGEFCFRKPGYTYENDFRSGIRCISYPLEATTENFLLSFSFTAWLAISTVGYPSANLKICISVKNGSDIRYLTDFNTWGTSSTARFLLENIPTTNDLGVNWGLFKVIIPSLPISGEIYIDIWNPSWASHTSEHEGAMNTLYLKDVLFSQQVSGEPQPLGQNRTITLNKSTSSQTKELKLYASDVPIVPNSKLIFKNYTSFYDGTLTGQWIAPGITTDTLLNVLTKINASNNRKAKQVLKGKIKGNDVSFGKLVQVNYPYSRLFEYVEFSYDLIADSIDVVLQEVLTYVEPEFSTTDEPYTESNGGSSSGTGSGGSSSMGMSDTKVLEIVATQKGIASGIASLDSSGLVPSSQLPSYVDDVLEFATLSAFPATGETGKIYVSLGTNLTYRWSGSSYVLISPTDHNHSNKSALDLVSGTNTGDQDISAMTHTNRAALDDITSTKITHWETAYADTNEATSANTASKIVKRDANGSVEIGTEIIKARSVEIVTGVTKPLLLTFKNTSDVKKWFFCLGSLDEIEIYNATGVKVLTLTQTGELRLKDEITAFSTT